MCKVMEDLKNEVIKESMTAVAIRMLEAGKYAIEEIAVISGLPLEEVKLLAEGRGL